MRLIKSDRVNEAFTRSLDFEQYGEHFVNPAALDQPHWRVGSDSGKTDLIVVLLLFGSCRPALERRPSGLSQSGYSARHGSDSMRGFGRRAAMPSALSVDLRERVVGAIEQGSSRRQAAKRFGVSPASAIRWHEGFVQQGRLTPKPQGGDQRSHRIEAHAALILQTCEAYPQIFLRELRDALQEQGVEVSTSSLSRFFARHAITRKKGRRTRLSRSGRT